MRSIILTLTLLAAMSSPVLAQSGLETCPEFAAKINDLVEGKPAPGGQDPGIRLLDISQNTRCFALFVVEPQLRAAERPRLQSLMRLLDGSRGDKQSGAGAGSGATTSVVSQGPAAKAVSLAAEHGAVTQSVNGQSITLRANPAGLVSALVRNGLVPYCVKQDTKMGVCVGESKLAFLRRLSVSATFNAVQEPGGVTTTVGQPAGAPTAAGQPVVFNASRNQLSSASARLELWQRRDVESDSFIKKWRAEVGKQMNDVSAGLLEDAGNFAEPINNLKAYEDWRKTYATRITAAGQNRDRIVTAFHEALVALYPIVQNAIPDVQQKAASTLTAYNSFLLRQDEVIADIGTKKVLALEFTTSRPTSKPPTSNLRLILDLPITKNSKLVGNAAVTRYDESQTNTDGTSTRYRDAQAALQYDRALGDLVLVGPITFSAAVYYQYQHAPAILTVDPLAPVPGVTFVDLPDDAKKVFAEKGDIILGQLKFSVTPKNSSVKVPLSITYSNRTELIAKPVWKGQIGITYDFDKLFARDR